MALELGDVVIGGAQTVTLTTDGSADSGDAVAINGGKVTQADSTTDTNVIGVLGANQDDSADGDKVAVHIGGVVCAKVASGTSAGTELGASATEGELGAGSAGIQTLGDEGGVFMGQSAPTGGAVVHLG